MKIEIESEALDSLRAMTQKLQDERDDLWDAAVDAVNQCIRLGSQYGTDGHCHNEALANLQEAIAKCTAKPGVLE